MRTNNYTVCTVVLCTKGVSQVAFLSLEISKLFFLNDKLEISFQNHQFFSGDIPLKFATIYEEAVPLNDGLRTCTGNTLRDKYSVLWHTCYEHKVQ